MGERELLDYLADGMAGGLAVDPQEVAARAMASLPPDQREALVRAQRAAAAGYWPEHDRVSALTVAQVKALAAGGRFSTRGCQVKADYVGVVMADWLARTYFAAGYKAAERGGMFPAPPRPQG